MWLVFGELTSESVELNMWLVFGELTSESVELNMCLGNLQVSQLS
jgi:hypothetical protein